MFKVTFVILYDNLCLLIEMHQPFIFNVIIDMLGFKSSFVLCIFYLSHFFLSLFLPSFGLSVFNYYNTSYFLC